MNHITINDIWGEIYDSKEYNMQEIDKLSSIEVVPRRMMEMIIDECNEIIDNYKCDDTNYACGRRNSAVQLHEYTKTLLKQFDEFGEDE